MGDSRQPSDAAVRERALDPARSFIVQAPAGSGKTALLTARVLRMLATVDEPEQIVALTFTRKAAAEMRLRILRELQRAGESDVPPADAHDRLMWTLAREALERDRERGWKLLEAPERLLVTTIDALCLNLVRRMPWLSRFGGTPSITDDPETLYREAAAETLEHLEERDGKWSGVIASLLGRLDNDRDRAVKEIVSLLGRREQWIRHVLHIQEQREHLEASLYAAVDEHLGVLRERFGSGRLDDETSVARELLDLFNETRRNLAEASGQTVLPDEEWTELPGTAPEDVPAWTLVARLLLTQEDRARRSFTRRDGVLPPSESGIPKEEKARRREVRERALALTEWLGSDQALVTALADTRVLPERAKFTDEEWEALGALATVLTLAVAELRLQFVRRRETDFQGVAHGAIQALGEPTDPTDLTFSLDAQVRHLLIDEFQDTSVTQVELVERLTAGWEPDDGRTLFLVGDPMQSIYSFREADVGLFLRSREQGIGNLQLEPLWLETNFRSAPRIVEWVNEVFPRVFPSFERIDEGAVRYAPSVPHRPDDAGSAVEVLALLDAGKDEQAVRVADVIEEELDRRGSGETVAVLVRGRNHLAELLPVLRERGVPFQGVDIEKLGERPVVEDLFALARALAHPADRVAWLAVLRAPWCGLDLEALHALAADTPDACVWDLLLDDEDLARRLGGNADALGRARRLREALAPHVAEAGRRGWRELVWRAWLAVGGPSAAAGERDLVDAEVFFDLLDRQQALGTELDMAALEAELDKLYAEPDAEASGGLQVLTVHKAKGLEFDTVILPFLERTTQGDREELISWLVRPRASGDIDLLAAPIGDVGWDESPTGRELIRAMHKRRATYERQRLAYVAATRARKRLHLVATAKRDTRGHVSAPKHGTLAGLLWPALGPHFDEVNASGSASTSASAATADPAAPAATAASGAPESVAALDPLPWEGPVGPQSGEDSGSDLGAHSGAGDGDPGVAGADSGLPDPDAGSPPAQPPALPPAVGRLRRLRPDFAPPALPPDAPGAGPDEAAVDDALAVTGEQGVARELLLRRAAPLPRHVGTVVHRALEQIARDGAEAWNGDRVRAMRGVYRSALIELGLPAAHVDEAVGRVVRAVETTLASPRGRWILSGQHRHARGEQRVTGLVDGKVVHVAIDRTFVSDDDTRWIVDFKTGQHEGGDVETWLAEQAALYESQLARYATIMRARDRHHMGELAPRRIRAALYFPLLDAWHEFPVP